MTRYHLVLTTLLLAAGLGLSQNAYAGPSMDAVDAYSACMTDTAADYAQRAGSPERLAAKIANLCAEKEAAMAEAYILEFFPTLAADEAEQMASSFTGQIISAMYEVAKAEITRLRIEAEHAQ